MFLERTSELLPNKHNQSIKKKLFHILLYFYNLVYTIFGHTLNELLILEGEAINTSIKKIIHILLYFYNLVYTIFGHTLNELLILEGQAINTSIKNIIHILLYFCNLVYTIFGHTLNELLILEGRAINTSIKKIIYILLKITKSREKIIFFILSQECLQRQAWPSTVSNAFALYQMKKENV